MLGAYWAEVVAGKSEARRWRANRGQFSDSVARIPTQGYLGHALSVPSAAGATALGLGAIGPHLSLTDGSLDPDAFARYVAQDVHYLRVYARALAFVAAKAPALAETAMFARHAVGVFDVELALHAELLPALGFGAASVDATPVTPNTQAYNSYLLATACAGSFVDGLAAVLPCYWIYAEVGANLLEQGSTDARYQHWIDSYGGQDFTATSLRSWT